MMMSQAIRFMLGQDIKQWLTKGEKEGETKIQKFEYLENKKSFSDEIKNIYQRFWRAIIWLKIKSWWKIVDTSFDNDDKTNPKKFTKIVKIIEVKSWTLQQVS